jgi:hypothetical protein
MIKNHLNRLALSALIVISLVLATGKLSLAQSPTPQNQPSDSAPSSDNVKDIRDAVKEKVQAQINDLKKGSKRAFFGQITDISDQKIVLETADGNIDIQLGTDTAIIGIDRKTAKIDSLQKDTYAIAMGYLVTDTSLDCRRLVITEKPKITEKVVAFGKISDISKDGQLVTLKNDSNSKTYSISVVKTTKFTQNNNGSLAKISISDLAKGNFVVAIGTPDASNGKIITASWINQRSGESDNKPTPTPSKSASKATPTTPADNSSQ